MRKLLLVAAAVVFVMMAASHHAAGAAGSSPRPRAQATVTMTPAQACKAAIDETAARARTTPGRPVHMDPPAVCDGTDPGDVLTWIMTALEGGGP